MTTTMLPMIHMNGTSAEELERQADAARTALMAAQDVLTAAAPNARDYYVIGPDAFRAARAEHEERQRLLSEMIAHYERAQLRAMGED